MATTIEVVKLDSGRDGQDAPRILKFETVASYNWLDEPQPTILVPGQLRADGQQDHLLTDSCHARHSANLGSTSDKSSLVARHWRHLH